MKVNFSALKDTAVSTLKMVGYGVLFSAFVGVGTWLTAPFGLAGMIGTGAWMGAGCLLFYKPIKRNYEKLKDGAVRFSNDLSSSKVRSVPIQTKTRANVSQQGQYVISPTADKSVKTFLKKQAKAEEKAAAAALKNADKVHRAEQRKQEKEVAQRARNPENQGDEYGRKSFWEELKSTFLHNDSRDAAVPPTVGLAEKEAKEKREKLMKTLKTLSGKILPKKAPKAPEPKVQKAPQYQPKGAYHIVSKPLEVSPAQLEKYRSNQKAS